MIGIRKFSGVGVLAFGLGAGCALIASAIVVLIVTAAVRPMSVPAPEELTRVPVETMDYFDERPVTLTILPKPSREILAPQSGTVTSTTCSDGEVSVDSGTSPLSIDDQPIIALASSIPLWRNVNLGDRGRDVEALGRELERLGYLEVPGDEFTWTEAIALARLRETLGGAHESLGLLRSETLWLPARTTLIGECAMEVGTEVEAGRTVIGTVTELPEVSMTVEEDENQEAADRVRTLSLDGTVLDTELNAETGSSILTASALAELARLPAYTQALASVENDQPITLAATSVLREPRTGALVPPSALTVSADDSACVADGAKIIDVTVSSSRLGQTIVLFGDDERIPESIEAEGPRSCE